MDPTIIGDIIVAILGPILRDMALSLLGIQADTQSAAKESNPYNLEQWIGSIRASLIDPSAPGSTVRDELTHIDNHITAVALTLAQAINNIPTTDLSGIPSALQAILDAIEALPAPSPPAPGSDDNALAVWQYQNDYRNTMGNMLSKLDETNFKLGPSAAHIAPGTSWFAIYLPTSFID